MCVVLSELVCFVLSASAGTSEGGGQYDTARLEISAVGAPESLAGLAAMHSSPSSSPSSSLVPWTFHAPLFVPALSGLTLVWCLHISQRVFSCVDQVFDVHVNHVDSVLHRGVFRPEASFTMWPPSLSKPTSVPLANFVHCCQGFGHVRESEAHGLRGPVLRLERDLLVSEILYLRSATRWNLLFCAAFTSGISWSPVLIAFFFDLLLHTFNHLGLASTSETGVETSCRSWSSVTVSQRGLIVAHFGELVPKKIH